MDDSQLADLAARYSAEQRAPEVAWFYRAAEAIKPRVIVEIGIKVGGNFKILSTLLDEGGLAVGIDPWDEISAAEIASAWKMDDARCRVRHIRLSSHDATALAALQILLDGRPIDVLFIDGDHSEAGMLADYADYSPLVRSGGLVAVHDIYYLPAVAAAWAQLPGEKYESPRLPSSIGIGYLVNP